MRATGYGQDLLADSEPMEEDGQAYAAKRKSRGKEKPEIS